MMHGRGKIGAAPVFDTWAITLPVRWCRVQFFFFVSRYAPISADSGRINLYQPKHTDSGHTGTKQAEIQKKKKKEVQNAPFELNNKTLNYLSSQPNSFFNLQLFLTLCAP